ncbi:MAG: hypothetical protein M3O15_12560, partial [Acidobacteriota bacterium]|nr:hypothetical protein [Acidobacteriota bacterium]
MRNPGSAFSTAPISSRPPAALFSKAAIENPSGSRKALDALEGYLSEGNLPTDQEEIREFLENLALGEILGLLSPDQRALLRASTLFQFPAPLETLEYLGRLVCPDALAGARLLALGLWEVREDPALPGRTAVAVNALAKPRAGTFEDAESARL